MQTKQKPVKPIDLSEYAEEAVPFDTVMRKILKAKPAHRAAAKPKPTTHKRK
jgi:hypothetical protein